MTNLLNDVNNRFSGTAFSRLISQERELDCPIEATNLTIKLFSEYSYDGDKLPKVSCSENRAIYSVPANQLVSIQVLNSYFETHATRLCDKLGPYDIHGIRISGLTSDVCADAALEILSNQEGLLEIRLQNTHISKNLLPQIAARFPNLLHLELHDCTGLGNRALESLAAMKNLRRLSISRNPYRQAVTVSDSDLQLIGQIPNLNRLSFQFQGITGSGLQYLHQLHDLEWLDLYGNRNFTDEGCHLLSELKELRSLSLASTEVTNGCLEHIVSLEKLEMLYLMNTQVSLGALRVIGQAHIFPHLDNFQCETTGIMRAPEEKAGVSVDSAESGYLSLQLDEFTLPPNVGFASRDPKSSTHALTVDGNTDLSAMPDLLLAKHCPGTFYYPTVIQARIDQQLIEIRTPNLRTKPSQLSRVCNRMSSVEVVTWIAFEPGCDLRGNVHTEPRRAYVLARHEHGQRFYKVAEFFYSPATGETLLPS